QHLVIGMVHPHVMLMNCFTVLENIMLGHELVRHPKLNFSKAKQEIDALSKRYNLNVDPMKKVSEITVAQQQRVEILKILYRGADIMIFDEPTAVLTPQEITEFIEILKGLALEGKSIILITHKLEEIKQTADEVTVIRAGKS
ncbi:ATP-binding cassette domain-containing protein, partial [Lactobacillus sp. XV13L]|nr:ATP-binding cassette domain-containing protein [Lactobacillus sp. XV13L]